jgi:hypothetical protein
VSATYKVNSQRRADRDRRHVHDEIRELEHRFGQRLDDLEERPPGCFCKATHRKAEDYREHCHLEQLVLGDGFGEIFRNNVQQKLVPRLHLSRCRRSRDAQFPRQPHSCVADIDRHQPHRQRNRRRNFKVDQRLQPDAAHVARTPMRRNSADQGAQD